MKPQPFNLQPTHLENDLIKLIPLAQDDFEELYAVASDSLIWEQHPNPDRYKRSVFETYFAGAMESKGAFFVMDQKTGTPIGCSRYYDHDADENKIFIGYTFLARSCWGKPFNAALKAAMLDYAFAFVDKVHFHIGANNIRSQKAIAKIGALKIGEETVAYHGEPLRHNFLYELDKATWMDRSLAFATN